MVDHTRRGTQRARSKEAGATTMPPAETAAAAAVGATKRAALLPERKMLKYYVYAMLLPLSLRFSAILHSDHNALPASSSSSTSLQTSATTQCRVRVRMRVRVRVRVPWQRVTCSWLAVNILWACGRGPAIRSLHSWPPAVHSLLCLSLGLSEMKRPCVRAGSHCHWAGSPFPFLPFWHDTA